jgi:hypothetical protein
MPICGHFPLKNHPFFYILNTHSYGPETHITSIVPMALGLRPLAKQYVTFFFFFFLVNFSKKNLI